MTRGALALVAALIACGPGGSPEVPDLSEASLILATAADDYSIGGLAAFAPGWPSLIDVGTLHGDAVVSVDDGSIYAINRLGMDTVRRYDALGGPPTWEISTGRGSNPHAVARVGQDLLITRYEEAALWVVDAASGAHRHAIDLLPYADDDGLPEASGAVADGDRVLVALQRLDRPGGWVAEPVGLVLVVDPGTGLIDAALEVGPNPRLTPHPDGGAVVIADDGLWRVDASGVRDGPVRPAGLDGTIGALAVGPDGAVLAVTRPCPTCSEHRVACLPAWDAAVQAHSEPVEAYLPSVAVTEDGAWVAARRGWSDPERQPGGLIPVDPSTCEIPPSESWLRGTLPPFAVEAWRSPDR